MPAPSTVSERYHDLAVRDSDSGGASSEGSDDHGAGRETVVAEFRGADDADPPRGVHRPAGQGAKSVVTWTKDDQGDLVCEHGTAADVHCCNCHAGFQFDYKNCVCVFEDDDPSTVPEGTGDTWGPPLRKPVNPKS